MNTNKYKEKNTKVGLESNSRNIFLVGKSDLCETCKKLIITELNPRKKTKFVVHDIKSRQQ